MTKKDKKAPFTESDIVPYETTDLTGERVVVFSPHPDDETIGCGGAIAAHCKNGDRVKAVIFTNGDKADASDRFGKEEYVRLREEEALRACGVLGVEDTEFWGYPDRELTPTEEVVERVSALLKDYKPTLVYSPSPTEVHPDHRGASRAVWEAARVVETSPKVVFYELGVPIRPNLLVDITPHAEVKKKALRAYETQLEENDYLTKTLGLNRYRTYTLRPEVEYAEGFYIVPSGWLKKVPYDDLERRMFEPLPKAAPDRNPLVSVIVRTYNRPGLLWNCLESLLKQTYKNFEVVLVNDGGQDVAGLVSEFSGKLEINHIRHTESKGRPAALNTGLENSRGRLIAFLDDDDVYYPDHLMVLVRHLAGSGYKVAYASTISRIYNEREGAEGGGGGGGLEFVKDGHLFDAEFDRNRLLFENFIPIMCVMLDRGVVEKIGRFDEKMEIYEDWDYWIRASRLYDFLHIRETTAEYRYYDEETMLPLHALKFDFEDWSKRLAEKHEEYMSAGTPEEKDRLLLRLEGSIAEMKGRIESLERSVSARDETISTLNETIGQKGEEVTRLDGALRHKEGQLNNICNSNGWKALLKYYRVRDRILSKGGKRRKALEIVLNFLRGLTRLNLDKSLSYIKDSGFKAFLSKVLEKLTGTPGAGPPPEPPVEERVDESYLKWIERNEPSRGECERQRGVSFPSSPVISLVVSAFHTRPPYLKEMVESVLAQTYGGWELCVACGRGSGEHKSLAGYARNDRRIKVKPLATDMGTALNSNEALGLARVGAEFVACVRPHDTLPPFALFEVVKAVGRNPGADFLYSDNDSISPRGTRLAPHFKPDWSPDTLRSWNYVSDLAVIKRSLLVGADLLRPGFEGAETYDLVFRATEAARSIVHIPKVLYHSRLGPDGEGCPPPT